jgi:hypothetical protein
MALDADVVVLNLGMPLGDVPWKAVIMGPVLR